MEIEGIHIPEVFMEHEGTFKFVQIKGPDGKFYLYGSSRFANYRGYMMNLPAG